MSHARKSSPSQVRPVAALFLAGLAIAGLSLSACGTSRSLGASLDDLEANAVLKRVLFTDRTHDYGDIDLTVFEGRLLLTGTMQSEEGRRKLVENAWKATGVKQVIDEVYVGDETPIGQGVEDSRIDATLRTKLVTDSEVRSSNVKIAVSNSVVYLLGVARDRDQLERIIVQARNTAGVSKVVSHMLYLDTLDRRL